jgi:SAM-dependent methyltransferase
MEGSLVGEYDFEFRALIHAVQYREWIRSIFQPYLHGRVLEVGCGVGQFTRHLLMTPGIAALDALEPDDALAAQFAITDSRVTRHSGFSQQFADPGIFDAVVSINVLEHIERDDPELDQYAHILKPGTGHLCILVPGRKELYSPIDRKFGHWRRYTTAELNGKLERAGFRPLYVRYFNLVGYFTWLLNFRLMGSLSFSESSVQFFDRFIVPVAKAIDGAGVRPIGQSVVAIATPR